MYLEIIKRIQAIPNIYILLTDRKFDPHGVDRQFACAVLQRRPAIFGRPRSGFHGSPSLQCPSWTPVCRYSIPSVSLLLVAIPMKNIPVIYPTIYPNGNVIGTSTPMKNSSASPGLDTAELQLQRVSVSADLTRGLRPRRRRCTVEMKGRLLHWCWTLGMGQWDNCS